MLPEQFNFVFLEGSVYEADHRFVLDVGEAARSDTQCFVCI